ncbi:MAG: four-carbon acid sugar kinase family protein [Prevotella sp.]|nr:four-carbon acid sugar kinase family protein [Prevotella sp.]
MIYVIADDITGAAEIAGLAKSRGLRTAFFIEDSITDTEADVVVIATNIRSSGGASQMVSEYLNSMPADGLLFLKMDSALRGYVKEMTVDAIGSHRYDSCLYLPCNPSKGRVIRDGVYYVNDVPIAETAFSYDPEFPITESHVTGMFPFLNDGAVYTPDAVSIDDMRAAVAAASEHTAFAGGADLFCALIDKVYPDAAIVTASIGGLMDYADDAIIVCGSTQSNPAVTGRPVAMMPDSVFHGTEDGIDGMEQWIVQAEDYYDRHGSVVLAIPHDIILSDRDAQRLTISICHITTKLYLHRRPRNVVIEGGATAFCLLKEIGGRQMAVVGQLAPGVVCLESEEGVKIVLKPGSYKWG